MGGLRRCGIHKESKICFTHIEHKLWIQKFYLILQQGASTPLMEAAQEGYEKLVDFLIEAGAKVITYTLMELLPKCALKGKDQIIRHIDGTC